MSLLRPVPAAGARDGSTRMVGCWTKDAGDSSRPGGDRAAAPGRRQWRIR